MIEMEMDGENGKESVFVPVSHDEATGAKEGAKITLTIKGKVLGSVAREGDAAEFESPGTIRVEVESVKVGSKGEQEEFFEDDE